MFIKGQKVVCVDDKFDPSIARFYVNLPKKDVVYVVRDVVLAYGPNKEEGEIAVYLLGMKNPPSSKEPYPERGFKIERFAPLDTITELQEEEIKEPAYV